jgi:outer membrane protein TolC
MRKRWRRKTSFSERIAQSSYYPQINSGAKWFRQDVSPSTVDQERWQLFVTADWNFWEWGSTQQRVAEAAAQTRKTEYELKKLLDQAQFDVHEA